MTRITKWAWVPFGLILMGTAAEATAPTPFKAGRGALQGPMFHLPRRRRKGGRRHWSSFPQAEKFHDRHVQGSRNPQRLPPTDRDLLNTVTHGMAGSAMPGFSFLSREIGWALVSHVKKLASLTEKPEKVIDVSSPPRRRQGALALGKQLYREMKCWECHGDEGRADGPSTSTHKDDWGRVSSRTTLPAGSTRGRNSLRHRPSLCHGDGRDADALSRRFAQGAGALGAGSVRAVPGGSEGGGSAVHGNGCGEESLGARSERRNGSGMGEGPRRPRSAHASLAEERTGR